MTRARKLFPIYGSALANNMIVAIERGHIVGDFVTSYVGECKRSGILGGPSRDKELAETIGREVVLAMIVEVRRLLPRFYGKTSSSKLKQDEKVTIELFFHEWNAALGRAWNWQVEDRDRFARDLALYADFGSRDIAPKNQRTRGKARPKAKQKVQQPKHQDEPPFVGRVALLLDPSMIDQARRAARKFHGQVVVLSQKLLRQTLHPGNQPLSHRRSR